MLSWRWWVPVSLTIILVDFGDFLDGVVARFWVDKKKEEKAKKDAAKDKLDSDDDSFGKYRTILIIWPVTARFSLLYRKHISSSFIYALHDICMFHKSIAEVVSIGRPQKIASWSSNCRAKSYGGFVDAVCDKVYVVPCWIFLLSTIPGTRLRMIQYVTLWCLILAEAASGTVRFRAYFTAQGVQAPRVVGLDFSTSAVKADGIGKAKQTLEMVGSALYVLPWLRYPGLLLLSLAVPLAYESVRRKIKKRVIYVDGADQGGNVACHKTLRFWMQARGMGSKLIVGVVGKEKTTDMVLNACACSAVDEVIAEAPEMIDLDFLTTHGIDYVLCSAGKAKDIAHDELVEERRILQLHEDGAARPLETKVGAKTE